MRIIDKDIQTYEASLETEVARLRRCLPKDEPAHHRLVEGVRAALDGLKAYRAAMDSTAVAPLEL